MVPRSALLGIVAAAVVLVGVGTAAADVGACEAEPVESVAGDGETLGVLPGPRIMAAEAPSDPSDPGGAGPRLLCWSMGDPECTVRDGAPPASWRLSDLGAPALLVGVGRLTRHDGVVPLLGWIAPGLARAHGVRRPLERPPRY